MHENLLKRRDLVEPRTSQRVQTLATLKACIDNKEPILPDSFIKILSRDPTIELLYKVPAKLFEKSGSVTVGEHTHNTCKALYKYPELGSGLLDHDNSFFNKREFQLLMALHDLGKQMPTTDPQILERLFNFKSDLPEGRSLQQLRTIALLTHMRHELPFTDAQFELVRFLIIDDRIGEIFKQGVSQRYPPKSRRKLMPEQRDKGNQPLAIAVEIEPDFRSRIMTPSQYREIVNNWEGYISGGLVSISELDQVCATCLDEIRRMHMVLKIPVLEILSYQILYFQCDIWSYTGDCPDGTPSLDYIFARNQNFNNLDEKLFTLYSAGGRFLFTQPYETIFNHLLFGLQ